MEYQEHELLVGSMLSTLTSYVPSLFTATFREPAPSTLQSKDSAAHQPIALASICYAQNMILFSLSRDRKLRIWNLITHKLLKTVPTLGGSILAPEPHKYLQVFDESLKGSDEQPFDPERGSFKLALYSPPGRESEAHFLIYSASVGSTGEVREWTVLLDKHAVQEESDSFTGSEPLVDFIIVDEQTEITGGKPSWTLWSLWNQSRTCLVRYCSLNLSGSRTAFGLGDQWVSVDSSPSFKEPLVLASVGTSLSLQEQYLEFLFTPGRFSFGVLYRALESILPPSVTLRGVQTWSALKVQVSRYVGYQMSLPDDSGINKFHAFADSFSSEYVRFLNLCIQFEIQESIPACLFFVGQERKIIQKGNRSLLRPLDPNQAIVTGNPIFLMAPDEMVRSWGWSRELCRKELRADMSYFVQISRLLQDHIPKDLLAALDRFEVDRMLESLDRSASDYATLLRERYLQEFMDSDVLRLVSGAFTGIRHLHSLFRVLLNVVSEGGWEKGATQGGKANDETHQADDWIADVAFEMIEYRHTLSRNILLAMLVASVLRLGTSSRLSIALVSEAVVAFHSLSVLKRLSETRVEAPLKQIPGSILSQLSSLSVGEARLYNASPLLGHLIRQHYLPNFDVVEYAKSDKITLAASEFIHLLGLVQRAKFIKMADPVLLFANKMMAFGHTLIASDVLSWYPASAGASFLQGRIWMEQLEHEKARACFEHAASGLLRRNESDLALVVSPDVVSSGMLAYATLVMNMFAEKRVPQMVIVFAKMAIECAPPSTSHDALQSLKKMLFHQSLEVLEFDEAYGALVSITDNQTYVLKECLPNSRLDCLRRFVSGLCEHGDIDGLVRRFPYVGMTPEVEKTLQFKARTESLSSVIKDPSRPNYYKILYSYFVYRNDFRQGRLTLFAHSI